MLGHLGHAVLTWGLNYVSFEITPDPQIPRLAQTIPGGISGSSGFPAESHILELLRLRLPTIQDCNPRELDDTSRRLRAA